MQKKLVFFSLYSILALVLIWYIFLLDNDKKNQEDQTDVSLVLKSMVWNNYDSEGHNVSKISTEKASLFDDGHYLFEKNNIAIFNTSGKLSWDIQAIQISKVDNILYFEKGLELSSHDEQTGFAKYSLLSKSSLDLTTMILKTESGLVYKSNSVSYRAESMEANLRTNKIELGSNVKAVF